MTPDGAFFSRDGERIAVQQPKVVIASNNDGRKSASLIAGRLALGLFHFFDGPDKQNRLVCADWPADAASHSSVCAHPLIFAHDLGSTFGSEKGMNFMSANPRGRFSAWKGQTVFRDLQTCELSVPLGGDKRVFKEAQDLMVQRLKVLDATTVRSIFAVARFQIMDREQRQRLRHEGLTNVEGAALDEWTRAFLDRIQEIRNARNCRVS
jgi:hypothetical protein